MDLGQPECEGQVITAHPFLKSFGGSMFQLQQTLHGWFTVVADDSFKGRFSLIKPLLRHFSQDANLCPLASAFTNLKL